MKTTINIGILLMGCLCVLLVITSCSNKVDFGEQYQKTLYIVNSNELLYTAEHFFEAEDNEIVISVYCASSQSIGSDVRAKLTVEPRVLDSLNTLNTLIDSSYVHKVLLPTSHYQLNDEDVVIKAGKQYGTWRIPFNFTGLDPDFTYTLPVALVSNDTGYEINPSLNSIVYEIKMINRYSGNYAGSSQESMGNAINVQPSLKALSANTVRMPIHNLSDDWENIDTSFMVLTIAENGSVTIAPWGNAKVTDFGQSYYDAVRQIFELHYQFETAYGITYVITEIITKLN